MFKTAPDKEAKILAQHARKLLHRRKDLLGETTIADADAAIRRLEEAAVAKDERAIKESSEQLDKVFGHIQPTRADASWRENCEVLLVAFVLAIGIRAYFLQPFKIPTGSMQPTLNGITAHLVPAAQPLPGGIRRTFDWFALGRAYVDAVSEIDDEVVDLQSETRFFFMDYTRIKCASKRSYLVHVPLRTLTNSVEADGFGLFQGKTLRAGEPIARGYVATGDQVFVDKFTYNFRLPKRADVFVFSTRDIPNIRMDDPNVKSEFYIKRLGGVPGDTLRIDHPRLFVNGSLAQEAPFHRVMDAKDGYRGYSNMPSFQFRYLLRRDDTFTVPSKSYFALGDNSYNSSDSRAWGIVPEENVVGRGLFVYWPFTSHWGLIR